MCCSIDSKQGLASFSSSNKSLLSFLVINFHETGFTQQPRVVRHRRECSKKPEAGEWWWWGTRREVWVQAIYTTDARLTDL